MTMTQLKLRIQIEDNSDSVVSVAKDDFMIGRLPTCDLCLPFSEISRNHAHLIKHENGDWLIEDLGSMNGTLLNQTMLNRLHKLHHGDLINVGNVTISVLLETPKATPDLVSSSKDVRTVLRSAEQVQQQWLQPDLSAGGTHFSQDIAIARLQHLIKIAKGLNAVSSIEGIFGQVQSILFGEFKTLQRLALLIDIQGTGHLKLMQAASRYDPNPNILMQGNWISRSICKKVFVEKVAIKTVDAKTDRRFAGEDSILTKGIEGAIAVPLWDQEQVVGVLYADSQLYYLPALDPQEDEDLGFFSAVANLVASSVQRWLLTRKLQEEEKLRHQLERYHSPAVVQQMIAVGVLENGRIKPVETDTSILFADLVSFSTLSEQLSPNEISDLLNRLFEEMLKPVFEAGGTLDKFIGDCIMAFFGAPEPQANHADRAVAAAKGMLERLQQLNLDQTWSQELQLRIAINSGKAVVGDVGSSQRVDYTVLGTTVNLAARMETICRPGECVISEATYSRLTNPTSFEIMGNYRLKGFDHPVQLYHLPNPYIRRLGN
jgi:adenylate cyclase